MARTAPAPDIPPIPGMCPSIAVLAGGGDGGGGGGDGAGDGSGDVGAGAGSGGQNAGADGRGAPDYQKYPKCGYQSHPVDVMTGRVFTHPIVELFLPGPLPLRFARMYSSTMAERDMGLGHGWGHTLGWCLEVHRRHLTVWNEQGVSVDFAVPPEGGEVPGPWGWQIRRDARGYVLDADDGVFRRFTPVEGDARRLRLASIEDRNRNRIELSYEEGRLSEVRDAVGRVVRFKTTREGRISEIEAIDPAVSGRAVVFASYTYDDRGNLAAATDADGFVCRYGYDDDHRMTSDTDRAGLTFHFVYDARGRCTESWGDYGERRDPSLADDLPRFLADERTRAKGVHHCRFDYGADGYTEVADATQVLRFFGNARGQLDKEMNGRAVSSYTYDQQGFQLSRVDPLGAVTSFVRDARGRVLQIVDPLGRTTLLDRDAMGLPVQIVDPAGAVTQAVRDRFGNPIAVTDPLGRTTTYTYDDRGLVTTIVDPLGARTSVEYDAWGNPIAITLPNGAVHRSTWNGFGWRLSTTDPLGATRRFVYSRRGDLVAEHDPEGGVTSYVYDGERHLVRHTSPGGATTELLWGGYQKLSFVRNAAGHIVRAAYNRVGDLLAVYNELGEAHRFTRDVAGWVLAEETFDGRKITYRRDLCGRPTVIRAGGGSKIEMAYDASGALVERRLDDDATEAFTYDSCGRLASATGPAGAVTFAYDACGRRVRETQIVDDDEVAVEVALDPAGRRRSRVTTLGLTEHVERDLLGVPVRTTLGDRVTIEAENDLLGRETRRLLPGGGVIESAFDPLGRLARRRACTGEGGPAARRGEPAWLGDLATGVTVDRAYRYDREGNLIEAWDAQQLAARYEYDPLGQVLAMIPRALRSEVFRYDPAGNVAEVGGGREYAAGGRLARKGDTEYRWDDEGQLVEKRVRRPGGGDDSVWKYTWGADGLLRSVRAPGDTLVELDYDPFARRVKKRVSRVSPGARTPISVTRFVWDGDVLVHEIRQSAGEDGDPIVEEKTYCFEEEGFQPRAHHARRRAGGDVADAGWFHYLNDPSGAPDRLVDGQGRVVASVDRSLWGAASPDPEAKTETMLRLQGQYDDPETGLSYNRYRYFDPDAGRFISPDPLLLAGGLNAFAFRFNPVGYIDPLGLINIPTLAVPPPGTEEIGATMNREAGGHLIRAQKAGASQQDLAAMYEGMVPQIHAAAAKGGQEWSAARVDCQGGAQAFMGSGGGPKTPNRLVIMPDRTIHLGPPALLPYDVKGFNTNASPPRLVLGPPQLNPPPPGTKTFTP